MAWIISNDPPLSPPPLTSPLNLTPKPLPPAPPPPKEDDWYKKEDRSLTEDYEVPPIFLLMPPFLCRHSPPLLSVPYPPLHLSVFCCHFHPRQTLRIFSVAPLYVLLSGPPASIIYPSPQNLSLPSICATSSISYP